MKPIFIRRKCFFILFGDSRINKIIEIDFIYIYNHVTFQINTKYVWYIIYMYNKKNKCTVCTLLFYRQKNDKNLFYAFHVLNGKETIYTYTTCFLSYVILSVYFKTYIYPISFSFSVSDNFVNFCIVKNDKRNLIKIGFSP